MNFSRIYFIQLDIWFFSYISRERNLKWMMFVCYFDRMWRELKNVKIFRFLFFFCVIYVHCVIVKNKNLGIIINLLDFDFDTIFYKKFYFSSLSTRCVISLMLFISMGTGQNKLCEYSRFQVTPTRLWSNAVCAVYRFLKLNENYIFFRSFVRLYLNCLTSIQFVYDIKYNDTVVVFFVHETLSTRTHFMNFESVVCVLSVNDFKLTLTYSTQLTFDTIQFTDWFYFRWYFFTKLQWIKNHSEIMKMNSSYWAIIFDSLKPWNFSLSLIIFVGWTQKIY